MISIKKLVNSNLQSSFRSDLPEESSSHKTNPIVNQIKLLNQQNIQVRRPSDITAEQRLESISSAQQGIQQSKTIHEEENKLNLINEESSLKEQSHHLQSSLKKSIISQIQDPLIESDYYSRELLIRKPVSWDTLYTVVSENKQLKILPIEIINDNCTPHSNKQIFLVFVLHQLFILIFSVTYLSLISLILFSVANNDYNLVYHLQIQLILLILPIIQLVINYYLDGGLTLKDLSILTVIVPFMVYSTDSNKTYIFVQLIYLLMMIKIKENIIKIKLIVISSGYYIYYWVIIKLLQLHFYQQFLGILITYIIQPKLQIYSTLIYILKYDDQSNFGAYILQLITISFICFYTSNIVVELTSLFRFNIAITEQLIQLSTSLGKLPQQRKVHHLQKQLKDFHSLLLIENIQQDQIDEKSKQAIFEFKYREQLKELPIFRALTKHCLNDILHISKEQVYQPNQIIYHPNSLNQSLYLLVQGEVEVFQENGQQIFHIAKFNKKKAFNQAGFFLGQSTDVGLRSLTYSKILEIPFGEFHREMAKHPQDLEKFKMSQDKLTFCKAYESIDQRCYVCHHHHLLNNCHHVHYIPKKRFLIDYINTNTSNCRLKYERKRIKKYHSNTRNNQQNLEFVALNYRHLMQYSSEVSNIPQKRPKTITSIALHIENEDEQALAQQIQSLSPVQMIAQGSSFSSYPFLQQQPSESRSKVQFQEGQQSYKKYVKDSFVVHRKRQSDKRKSYAPEFERESQVESLQKYATVQDRRKSVNESNDDKSKAGIQQSSKFTGETSKQFMQSPLEIPLYDDQSFESNHQFSDYFPQHNIDQALQSYRVYQDSVLSSQKNNQQ